MSRYLIVLLFCLSAISAAAVELLSPQQVLQGENSATISWRTDVACGTRVSYGTNAAQLNQKAEGPVTTAHSVEVSGLTKGTTYYYSIGSSRQKLGEGTFTHGSAAVPAAPTAQSPAAPKSMFDRVIDALKPTPTTAKSATTTAPSRIPPTRETWGNISSLQDHYDRHGADFQSSSPDDYAAQAWRFLQRAKAGQLSLKWDDEDRTLRVFDTKTRAFAAYNRDGTTKTYFRPNSSSYWDRQPGRIIQPSQLPFKS